MAFLVRPEQCRHLGVSPSSDLVKAISILPIRVACVARSISERRGGQGPNSTLLTSVYPSVLGFPEHCRELEREAGVLPS